MYRVSAFHNRLFRSFKSSVQTMNSFLGLRGKYISRSLEVQYQSLKTLQQRVVQFPGDACPFREALLELHVQPGRHLTNMPLINRPAYAYRC